jgi:hypothetical protein
MAERKMTTKFAGKCVCNRPVSPQSEIYYDRDASPRIRGCAGCRPELAPDPNVPAEAQQPTAANSIRVTIQQVRYSSPNWTTMMVRIDPERQPDNAPVFLDRDFALVGRGCLAEFKPGDLIDAYGSWENNPKYGWQFFAQTAAKVVGGTLQALRAFLTQLPNVGLVRAEDIIQLGGNSRKAVIELIEKTPERLTAVKGITLERAHKIAAAFAEEDELRETAIYLAGLQLTEGVTAKILDMWGSKAAKVLAQDPYNLTRLRGVGFNKADEIAQYKLGIHAHDPRRLAAAALHLLQEEERDGHTYTILSALIGCQGPALDL